MSYFKLIALNDKTLYYSFLDIYAKVLILKFLSFSLI